MVRGILGKKVGMTQIFDDDGRAVPVTVVEAGPCVVVQCQSENSDGYEAVQIGLVEASPKRNATKPITGHFQKAGIPPTGSWPRFRSMRTTSRNPVTRCLRIFSRPTTRYRS